VTRGTTNIHKRKLIRELKKLSTNTGKPIWRRASELLMKPRRQRVEVNLSRINRHSLEGEVIIVPGRVLGAGKLDKKVMIIAESFTRKAMEKISNSGSQHYLLTELITNQDLLKEVLGKPKRLMS
jgi:large subunit ribosomal protein L18e